MGDWNILGSISKNIMYGRESNSSIKAITAHASANTKGSYVEYSSSTTFDIGFLVLQTSYAESTYDFLFDIAIGSAGNEVVIISNIIRSTTTYGGAWAGQILCCPIFIPAGTRLSARCQCSAGGKGMRLSIQAFSFDFLNIPLSTVTTYGATVADSGGISVDPGGSVSTKGTYSEITSSTTRPHKGVILGIGNQVNGLRTAADYNVDIAIGAANSEVILISNFHFQAQGPSSCLLPAYSCFYPVNIPIGTRLSIRGECSLTDATDRIFDAVLYCFS